LKGFTSDEWNALTGKGSAANVPVINDGIVYKDGQVVRVSDDDNIIATKNEPYVGDSETNRAAAVPVMPPTVDFSDANIVDVLGHILEVLKEKEFNPTINSGSDGGMDFDGLRTARAI
jgi:hypothetical protein